MKRALLLNQYNKKMKIKEDLMEILNDHRSEVIDMVKEDSTEALAGDVEANLDRMVNEIIELLGSSYE